MKNKYNKQLLTSESAKSALKSMKGLLAERSANTVTFSDVITEFVGKTAKFMSLSPHIRGYITAFTDIVSKYPNVCGVMLFGSVAKGTYNKDSDIDMLVVVDNEKIKVYGLVNSVKTQIEALRESFLRSGYHLRISVTVLEKAELKSFRPIYFDLLSYGIILYEKGRVLSDFLDEIRGIWHERLLTDRGEVIRWKTKQGLQ